MTAPVETWPQRARFKTRVVEYQERTGKTQPEVAAALGTTPTNLRNWLYNKAKRPKLENLQVAASVLGCSVTEFMDDPGRIIAGEEVGSLSEKRRFLAGLLFDGITSDQLTDEDAQLLYEDFLAARSRLETIKARTRNGS